MEQLVLSRLMPYSRTSLLPRAWTAGLATNRNSVFVQAPIAMGYVDKNSATTGKRIFGEVRGKRIALQVCDLPFVPHRYKRD